MDNYKKELLEKLQYVVGKENVYVDEPMSKHTTFRTGGKADFYVIPSNGLQIGEIICLKDQYNVPIIFFGNGSNTIVTDKGIRGIVVSLKGFNSIEINDVTKSINVGAGVTIAKVSNMAADHGLTGLEFACGIPGTVGGAIFMNAGAYGGEMKDVVKSVKYYLPSIDESFVLTNKECKFDYRYSVFQVLKTPIIMSCTLQLAEGKKEEIFAKMKENMESRNAKQPIGVPSAGSIFRREDGVIVAKLIDEAGLKGYKIGGAEVSTMHAGFIVNTNNATSKDILELIDYVKKVILEKYNVELHEEVKIVGER